MLQVFAQGYSPDEAVKHMSLPEGVRVQLFAHEPMIAQPVCIEFDDRGRLWVIQYLQYPNPAGLKRASVDRWSRTTYDRVPEPPPRGPRGADRITILEDENNHGRADRAHDFVDGLNLATGLAFGQGGVFVLNVPYLLFYPDKNQDDVPDGEPTACLSGFGMDDAHSVANSLTWGPDGWLYGCQGSTVTSRIRGIEFQQGVWRYHPVTREFELFCEGGGNSWGLDFDAEGELIYSTNVGPYRNLHGVQGAYYWKSVGKHGALHNPYAYGFFDHIPHTNFTGGHVTDGGIVYQGTNLPARFRGRYICGDLLGHGVQWHEMGVHGSTFTSAHGGYLLAANDTWFASTDVTMAPDGSVFVADWFDQRTAHPDPDATWDRSNGRVYRISAASSPAVVNLSRANTPQLVSSLTNANDWIVRKARRLLADRRDPEAIAPLRSLIWESANDHLVLQSLWALYVSGGFDEATAARAVTHRSAAVRKWAVRFLGDQRQVSPSMAQRLVALAQTEPDVRVRAQLAASAKRLPAPQAMPIVEVLAGRNEDSRDPHVPLLLWWAVERHAITAVDEVARFFTASTNWQCAIVREVIVERLMRRWIAEGSEATHRAAARLLDSAPDPTQRHRLLAACEQGFHDRPSDPIKFGAGGLFANTDVAQLKRPAHPAQKEIAAELVESIERGWRIDTTDPALIRLAALLGIEGALTRARALLADPSTPADLRSQLVSLLGELGDDTDLELLWKVFAEGSEPLQLAALDAWVTSEETSLVSQFLDRYGALSNRVRARLRQILLSRRDWARLAFKAVDSGQIPAGDFSMAELRVVALHQDRVLNEQMRKNWGTVAPGSPEEKLAEMRRLNNDLNAGAGDARHGRELFTRLCAACHTLFGEGGKVGPDLTHGNRGDREFLLASLVDPSAAMRKEYLSYELETKDGRLISGILVDQSGAKITLAVATGEQTVVPLGQVASWHESTLSLMPPDLYKGITPQELRDLFAYLQSKDGVKP